MLLHTKLTMAECLSRLKQPYLTNPNSINTSDTSGMIKYVENRWKHNDGSLDWTTVVTTSENEFEVQERTWIEQNNENYETDKSELQRSFKCSLKENPEGGTDIGGADIVVLGNKLFLAFGPAFITMIVGVITMVRQIHFHDSLYVIASGFALIIYTAFYSKKLTPKMDTVRFINELLDAKAPLFWRAILN